MKFKSSLLLLLLFISTNSVLLQAQLILDYPERSLEARLDSLRNLQEIAGTMEATEGSINPDEYYVGPGDKLFISIKGVTEITHKLTIDHEGWLYVPNVGGIDLRDLTLSQSKEKILHKLNDYYKDVSIFISLTDFRKIKVSLTGDVKTPSNFTFSANARLIELLDASNNLTETSDIRNIKIISKNNSVHKYDFLSFLRFGNYYYNPMLREGDVVIIDKVDKIVRISGPVKYPAAYEYVEGECIDDLINLAGGFTIGARRDTIELVRFDDEGIKQNTEYFSYNLVKNEKIKLKNKDHIIIRRIPEYLEEHYVDVQGFVNYPGWYKIDKDSTHLSEIINQAGGFRKDASLNEASLIRTVDVEVKDPEFERLKLMERKDMTEEEYDYFKFKSRQNTGKVVVDFVELFRNNNQKENVILKNGDVINVPERKNYIIMLGAVVNPGKIIYDRTLGVMDYIRLAGGFGWRAEEGEVRVVKANTGEWIDYDDIEDLEPGDTIWVPEEPPSAKFWEVFTSTLGVVAQVAAILAAAAALIIATR